MQPISSTDRDRAYRPRNGVCTMKRTTLAADIVACRLAHTHRDSVAASAPAPVNGSLTTDGRAAAALVTERSGDMA